MQGILPSISILGGGAGAVKRTDQVSDPGDPTVTRSQLGVGSLSLSKAAVSSWKKSLCAHLCSFRCLVRALPLGLSNLVWAFFPLLTSDVWKQMFCTPLSLLHISVFCFVFRDSSENLVSVPSRHPLSWYPGVLSLTLNSCCPRRWFSHVWACEWRVPAVCNLLFLCLTKSDRIFLH